VWSPICVCARGAKRTRVRRLPEVARRVQLKSGSSKLGAASSAAIPAIVSSNGVPMFEAASDPSSSSTSGVQRCARWSYRSDFGIAIF